MNDFILQLSYSQEIGPFEFTLLIGDDGIVIHVRKKESDDFES